MSAGLVKFIGAWVCFAFLCTTLAPQLAYAQVKQFSFERLESHYPFEPDDDIEANATRYINKIFPKNYSASLVVDSLKAAGASCTCALYRPDPTFYFCSYTREGWFFRPSWLIFINFDHTGTLVESISLTKDSDDMP